MKSFRKAIVVILMISLFITAATGCSSDDEQAKNGHVTTDSAQDPDQSNDKISASAESNNYDSDITEPKVADGKIDPRDSATIIDNEYIAFETAYGTLLYPDQWREFVHANVTPKEDKLVVTFMAEMRGKDYELFVVTIDGKEGEKVGNLTDQKGNLHPVYAAMSEIPKDTDLTDEEMDRLYAMQEDLNQLIERLK